MLVLHKKSWKSQGEDGLMKSYDVCECGAPLRLMERPTPKPAGTEVLVKIVAAGICHSDLHIWEGHYDLGGGKRLSSAIAA